MDRDPKTEKIAASKINIYSSLYKGKTAGEKRRFFMTNENKRSFFTELLQRKTGPHNKPMCCFNDELCNHNKQSISYGH